MTIKSDNLELTSLRAKCASLEALLKQERSERAFEREQVQEQIARTKEANAQAEEVLRVSRNDLAEAQRMAHIGSWRWNLETDEVTWSDEHWAILGLEPGDVSTIDPKLFYSFVHPDDLKLVQDTGPGSRKPGQDTSWTSVSSGATERRDTFTRGVGNT